jgi:hypothetical protein
VFKFCECSINLSWHGDIDTSFIVVPVKGEATVECAGPVDGQILFGFAVLMRCNA